ncbi:hypothetical protein GQ457_05G034350 [Hibiscus cannabinus]
MNPVSIERLEAFTPVSKLEDSVYGPQESAFRQEHIISQLDGMSVQQAIENKRLFILDCHDTYLPFLNSINANPDRKAYATRTIFFLTKLETLKPIAIELSLPPMNPYTPTKRVITSPVDATTCWQWQLAKAHVCSNDSGARELIQHWLRTHACMEPFIIAARRNLSSLFSTKESSMEITSFAYRNWRFDMESLPADLIRRGIAESDPTEPHGIKLLIQDYPYANNGLLIWSAIERLVKDYVNFYYPDLIHIRSDPELNAWYYESINVGHADLRHETWWPKLLTPEDLVSILTTLIWISSAQHAALNFGQYHYGAYVPVRPPYMRRLVPNEEDPDYPTDEEYLGDRKDLSTWKGNPEITEAFNRFSMEMRKIEKEIERRNNDPKLRNRCGAGVSPYQLLVPSSEPGVSCRGVPNSISI